MDTAIYNKSDLRAEIGRLRLAKNEQETAIKQHFNGPKAIFNTVVSIFSKHKTDDFFKNGLAGHDLSSLLSKFLLPLTLNKTLFRRSGFITRALVGIISSKASGFINDKAVVSFWDKIKSVIPDAITERFSPKRPKRRLLLPQGKTLSR